MEILDAWLRAEFAAKVKLNQTVKLSFEQNHGGIDGDSASLAEALVTLSALSELPIRQDLAITGSMNLNGDSQAIGGVNLKIEGFYDYVKRNGGIKPGHGVIIPFSNMQHLLLREDIIEAVREGNFTVTAVDDVWSAAELFFQMPREEIRKKLIENIRGKKSWFARLIGKK